MGELNLDDLGTDLVAERRHISDDQDLTPRHGTRGYGTPGGPVGDKEGETTLSEQYIVSPPIKVKIESAPTQAPAEVNIAPVSVPEQPVTPSESLAPSDGVMAYMAEGVGEPPEAEVVVTPEATPEAIASLPSQPEGTNPTAPETPVVTHVEVESTKPTPVAESDQASEEAKDWANEKIEQIKSEFNPENRQYGQDVVAKIKDDFKAGVRGQEAIGLKMPQLKEPEITSLPTWEEGPQKPLAADRGREALGLELPKDEIELPKNMETWEEVGKRFEEVEARLEETLAGLKEYLSKIEEEEAKRGEDWNPEYAGPVAAHKEIEPYVEKSEAIEPFVKAEEISEVQPEDEAKLPEIKLSETAGYDEITKLREAYLVARAKKRRWFARGDKAELEHLEKVYQDRLGRFLVTAAENGLDESLEGEERLQAKIELVTTLELQEMMERSEAEVVLANDKLTKRTLNWIKAHPWVRAGAGLALLGGSAVLASTGNIPVAAGMLAARSVLNGVGTAVSTEAGMDLAAGAYARHSQEGPLHNLTEDEIKALGDRHIAEKISAILARSVRRGETIDKTPEKELLEKLTAERRIRLQRELALELKRGNSVASARANVLMASLRNSMESERAGQERERRGAIGRWLVAGGLGVGAGVLTWVSGVGNLNKAETATRAAKDLTRHTTQNVAGATGGAETAGKTAAKEIYRQVADSNDGPEHMFRRALKNYALKHNIKLSDSQLVRAGDWMAQKHLKPLGLNWKGHSLWVATGAKAEITDHTFHLISPDGAGKIFDHTVKFGLADAIKAVQ